MSSYQITKTMNFSYGHRLMGHKGKCQYLHGHNGRLEVDVESESLDEMGMVMDFTNIREVIKGWIDENLDHKMILCQEDDVVLALVELGEPIYLVDDNPTAENLCRLIYRQAKDLGLILSEVRLWETPSSCAVYRESGK